MRERRGREGEREEGGRFLGRDRLREGKENEGGRDGGRVGREAWEGKIRRERGRLGRPSL